ncbi:hypothetical protein LZC95_50955 [Pendulispora brunnea]|uniref:Integral membrane protein n=1 Tax=Pendulispora brunnea TaxID=2905690 RepID=A0ABZ2K7R5_9BACT
MRNDSMLRTALRGNALYTALCGAVLLVDGPALAAPFGLSDGTPLQAVGAVFVFVAAALAVVAQRRRPLEALALTVADAGYVVASIALVLIRPTTLSAIGREATLLVAVGTAAFVAAQAVGLRRAAGAAVA